MLGRSGHCQGITIQVLHKFSGRYSYLRLERRNRERRMTSFYTMHLAPTFFGSWDLMLEWGRIGSPRILRSTTPSKR